MSASFTVDNAVIKEPRQEQMPRERRLGDHSGAVLSKFCPGERIT